MPNIWTIAIIAALAYAVLIVVLRYCREREYFARYEWKKKELARVRAEMDAARSKS